MVNNQLYLLCLLCLLLRRRLQQLLPHPESYVV